MFSNLAVFRERIGWHGNAIGAEFLFDHAAHRASATATGTEVRADAIFGITVATDTVALATMQPVEHHHRKFLHRAVAQHTVRMLGIDNRSTFLAATDPDRVTQGGHGVQRNFSCSRRLGRRQTFGAHIIRADGLLEIDIETFGRSIDRSDKPAAILFRHRNHRDTFTIQEHLGVGIGPRRKESHDLHPTLCRIVVAGFIRIPGIILTGANRSLGILGFFGIFGRLLSIGKLPGTVFINGDFRLL